MWLLLLKAGCAIGWKRKGERSKYRILYENSKLGLN